MKKSQKSLGRGQYLELVVEGKWEFANRIKGIGACAIVATTRDHELILVEQYRPALQADVIDLPAGLVGDEPDQGADYLETAHRELLEETGYQARKLTFMQAGPASSGAVSEVIHFFRGKNVKRIADGGGVEGEEIRVHVIPVKKVLSWFKSQEKQGKLIDCKTWFAAAMLKAELK